LTARLPEALLFAAGLLAAGCASDHHVSPWGERPGPTLDAFVRPPDLAAALAAVDAETASLGLGLVKTAEIRTELPKGSRRAAVLRGYEGRDAAGRVVHAVRVATPRGVVLAVGPLDVGDLDRRRATELVPSLPTLSTNEGGAALAFLSGTDLNGDGSPDVVLRNDVGELAVWHLGELGSGPYAVSMVTPVLSGIDADGDGKIDLWGEIPVAPGDPPAPRLTDVATFADGAYSDVTPAARAWHAREAAQPVPTQVGDAVRLRAAIERAWHAILAGQPQESVLHDLRREPVPPALRAWFEPYPQRLATLAPR
jgi:hypothetical protein